LSNSVRYGLNSFLQLEVGLQQICYLVVQRPRYIKIKYVPQQSFKVWSDPEKTMPAKMSGCILTYAFPHHEDKYHELFNI